MGHHSCVPAAPEEHENGQSPFGSSKSLQTWSGLWITQHSRLPARPCFGTPADTRHFQLRMPLLLPEMKVVIPLGQVLDMEGFQGVLGVATPKTSP